MVQTAFWLVTAFVPTTILGDLVNGVSHVCVHHLGTFELRSRVVKVTRNDDPAPLVKQPMGQAFCHNLAQTKNFDDGDKLLVQFHADGDDLMKEVQAPVTFNSSSPMWVTYRCHGKAQSFACEILREWFPRFESVSQSNESCALSLTDRTDCGAANQTGCESMGCCWQPVKPNPLNVTFCFHKASPGNGPAPPNKVLPFAPADCFVTSQSFSISELVLRTDLVYGSAVNPYVGGFDKTEILKLDVLTPPAKDQRKLRPAMVWVHGGSYLDGDKTQDRELREALAARGYVVFSINYRMVDDGAFPAIWSLLSIKPAIVAAQDARAAVRFVRKHAREWRVDPGRIVVGGESAGAITSNLYGYAKGTSDGASGNAAYDSAINAVVSVSGSMRDLAFCESVGGPPKYQPWLCLISSPPGKDLTNELSKGDIPIVDLHGTKDTTIPYLAGQEMITRATTVGVTSLLLTIPGAGHVPMHNIMDPKKPYLLQWLNFTSGALNLASAECPHNHNLIVI